MIFMSFLNAILPVLTLLLGAGLAAAVEAHRYRRDRRDHERDSLRSQRAEAYRDFVREAHVTAHEIGRTALGCPTPSTDAVTAWARVDSHVSQILYELELFAGEPCLAAARELRARLSQFRDLVMGGETYMSQPYRTALGDYQTSRRRFLDVARTELLLASTD